MQSAVDDGHASIGGIELGIPQGRRGNLLAMQRRALHRARTHTTRRRVLRGLGALATASGVVALTGCGDDGSGTGSSGDGSSGGDSSGGGSSGGGSSGGSSGASASATGSTGVADSSGGGSSDGSSGAADGSSGDTGACATIEGWASGGTASMCGNYPDPFTRGLGPVCELTCAATLGPCYANTLERKDISEGQPGLPVRLALKIVDTDCNPVADAEVDIWHTSADGYYSGDDASAMCTLGNPAAEAARWMRGVQTTDAEGRVDFDTCFPGWYSGRTIHIHFQIRIGGTEFVTSQLFFDDALSDEIVASEPVYSDRGPRDTTNANDNVIGGGDIENVVLQTERQSDGAMLAWRTLVLRTSTGTPLCQI